MDGGLIPGVAVGTGTYVGVGIDVAPGGSSGCRVGVGDGSDSLVGSPEGLGVSVGSGSLVGFPSSLGVSVGVAVAVAAGSPSGLFSLDSGLDAGPQAMTAAIARNAKIGIRTRMLNFRW